MTHFWLSDDDRPVEHADADCAECSQPIRKVESVLIRRMVNGLPKYLWLCPDCDQQLFPAEAPDADSAYDIAKEDELWGAA